jgi:hypothetical protein
VPPEEEDYECGRRNIEQGEKACGQGGSVDLTRRETARGYCGVQLGIGMGCIVLGLRPEYFLGLFVYIDQVFVAQRKILTNIFFKLTLFAYHSKSFLN